MLFCIAYIDFGVLWDIFVELELKLKLKLYLPLPVWRPLAIYPFLCFINVATKQYHLYVTAMWRCSPKWQESSWDHSWHRGERCRASLPGAKWAENVTKLVSWPRPSMNHLPTSILNLLGFTAPRKKVGVLQFWHWHTVIFKIFGEGLLALSHLWNLLRLL